MSHLAPFLTLLLLVLLQTTTTFALKCYGCLQVDPKFADPTSYQHCDSDLEDLVVDQRDRNSFLKKAADKMREELINSGVELISGPFCFEAVELEDETRTTSPALLRYIVPQAPKNEYLDEFGCYAGEKERICFCNRDLCNSDLTEQGSSAEVDESGSEHDGHEPSGGGGIKPTHGHGHKPKRPPGKKPKSEKGGVRGFFDDVETFFNSAVSFSMPSLFLLIVPTLITCYITSR